MNRGVEECFKKYRMPANIRTFYLDSEALLARSEIDTLTALLNEYREKAPDLIIACDDEATYSLISTRHPHTYRIPIVFCGVDYVNYELLPGHTNITGYTTAPDFVQCYRLAEQLFGPIAQIAVLIEDGYLGRIYKKDVYNQYLHVPEITTVEEYTLDSVFTRRYPPHPCGVAAADSVTLQIKRVDKMSGLQLKWNLFPHPHTVNIIPKWNSLYTRFPGMGTIPFLAVNNEGLGDGRIGGYMTPSYDQTYEAAETGIRILRGTHPAHFPVRQSKKVPVFDWNELQHWKIDRQRLPANSLIPNLPFAERYKKALLVVAVVAPVLIVCCLFLLVRLYKKEQSNKKRVQRHLQKERRELSITMESISEGVLSVDRNGDIVSINRAALHWLELHEPAENYLGKNIRTLFDIVSHADPNYFDTLVAQVRSRAESKSFGEDTYLVTAQQRSFPVSGSIGPVCMSGQSTGLVIAFRDVTEDYTQKKMLALSMIAGDIFVWRYDEAADGFIFDEAFFKATGLPDDSAHCMRYEEFTRRLHPDDLKKWRKLLALIGKRKTNKGNLQLRFRSGTNRYEWWEYRATTLSNSSLEEHYKLFGICLNIQHFKKTQEELIRFRDEAVESDRMKGVFMANMSHEIRTPLNAIVGFSNLLTENDAYTAGERKVFIGIINENCRLLLNLINEILDISRIESGIAFRRECCNLNDLFEEVATAHRPLAGKEVAVVTRIPAEKVIVETDRLRLKQLLDNLAGNAVKFTRRGSVTLGFSTDRRKQTLILFVSDTGAGISAQEQQRVFERFYKSDDFMQGGGLGLSICKEIVKRFDGSIRVESAPGKGTRFIVELPLLPVAGNENGK